MSAAPGAAVALVLLAGALVVTPGPLVVRARVGRWSSPLREAATDRSARWLGPVAGVAVGLATWTALAAVAGPLGGAAVGMLVAGATTWGVRRVQARPITDRGDPTVLAGVWDLVAACLRAGMPLPTALTSVAVGVTGAAGEALRRTAELLALGADPSDAWEPALRCAATARLARAARRSGRSGAAVAAALDSAAASARADARDRGEAAAQRAAVLVTGPLGLCFLPAFLALGVVPVVVGLASRLLGQW